MRAMARGSESETTQRERTDVRESLETIRSLSRHRRPKPGEVHKLKSRLRAAGVRVPLPNRVGAMFDRDVDIDTAVDSDVSRTHEYARFAG
jgi:hypothetical protein